MATGKVKNETALRHNLDEAATEFFELARAVPDQNGRRWWASRLRVDVWIDIEGKVHPEVSVGAEVKLRFEWFRLMTKDGRSMPVVQEPLSEKQEKFNRFVRETSDDARDVSYETFQKSGFFPNYIKMGIGLTAKGDFGVVKFGGGLYGYLYLSTDAPGRGGNRPVSPAPAVTTPALLIENDPKPEHLTYARQEGIPFEVTAQNRGFIKQIVYKIERGKFRRGLMRSVKLSSRMTERAAKPNGRKWKIHEIRPSFELSIGGDFKLVSVYGSAMLEMSYINGNF
jgi:hypothetical protein